MAVKRARKIMAYLVSKPLFADEILMKRTLHGELRIKNCLKFDLSNGYRLICLHRSNRLIFTYIGTHDDCHTWLENNRNLVEPKNIEHLTVERETEPPTDTDLTTQARDIDEYEEQLMARLDDQTLRTVLGGFAKQKKKT